MVEFLVKKIISFSIFVIICDNQILYLESLLFILELFEEGFKVSEEREFSLFLRRNDLESVEENLEGFQFSGGLSDLIFYQDQMRYEEISEINVGEQCVKIEEIFLLFSVFKVVKVIVIVDSNEDFVGVIIFILNIEILKKNSEKEFIISLWMEIVNLILQKIVLLVVEEIVIDGYIFYVDCKDSISFDLFVKVVREVMISYFDVFLFLDVLQFGRNVYSMFSLLKFVVFLLNQNLGFLLIIEMNN